MSVGESGTSLICDAPSFFVVARGFQHSFTETGAGITWKHLERES